MTTRILRTATILSLAMATVAWQGVEAKNRNNPEAPDTEKLAIAAEKCDMPTLKALIASGVNVSATTADGEDILSRASLNRKPISVAHGKTGDTFTLRCPAAVSALTDAGADPWKAGFYQNPRLNERRPGTIAVIRVEDIRTNKGDSDKLIDEMTDAVETQLGGRVSNRSGHLGYPILRLSEVRQKLLASGFSAEDAVAPDRAKACAALGVDSVFEASLEDFRTANAGIVSASRIGMKFTLTDCKTGALLWRSDQSYSLSEGVLVRAAGGNRLKQIISEGPQFAVSFPPYENGKE